MKSITINGSQRESVGKKATKALRNAGQVPCVLYGGDKPVHFSAAELAFSKLVYTPNAHTVVIALDNGDTFNAVLQDIQFHPVTDRILHIDFYQLFEDKEIAMNIPVKLHGTPRGVLNGGVLRRNKRKLRIKDTVGIPIFLRCCRCRFLLFSSFSNFFFNLFILDFKSSIEISASYLPKP